MSRTAGDSGEVYQMSKDLLLTLMEINELNQKGRQLLSKLAQSSKDKSYDTAEAVVSEVQSLAKAGLGDSMEVASKLKEYGDFLAGLENG